MAVEPSPPEKGGSVVKAKTERLTGEEIFTGERDERLDPLRARITILLTSLMALALLLHAALTFWASYGSPDAAKNIAAVFNIWVPVISGLVSSAVTWFFTRQK
jgi:hypothetical protein